MAIRFRSLLNRTKIVLFLSVIFVALWATSLTTTFEAKYYRCAILVAGGGVGVYLYTQDNLRDERLRLDWAYPIYWLPWFETNMSSSCLFATFIPMWCIAPFVFIPTYLLWRKDRHIPEGHCQKCGYNLAGNVSGKCSECGKEIEH